ncbi:MAG TPA: response regulator [Lentisphaeria bacterium]|nr:response regulator [Lentisphaeria bacterium]
MAPNFTDLIRGDLSQARDFLALTLGYAYVMRHGARQLLAYHNLIDDDARSLNQSTRDFIRNAGAITTQLQQWSEAIAPDFTVDSIRENLALRPILEGIADQCRKLSPTPIPLEVSVKGDQTIYADPYQMQQAVIDIILWLAPQLPPGAAVHLTGGSVQFTRNNFTVLRSECDPGAYSVIGITTEPLAFEDYIAAAEALTMPPKPNPDLNMLHWLGVAKIHHGDLFLHRDGSQRGVAMILEQPPPSEETTTPESVVSSNQETILLVDDEDMIWDVISNMLKTLGYTVLLAANGREAVDIYRNNPGQIDLVLLDMVMPEMNAREAFFILKEIDPSVKVLLSSGFVSEADTQDVLNAGAHGFLRKPYSMRDLAQKVRDILDN